MSKSVEKGLERVSAFYEDYAKKGKFYLGSSIYKDAKTQANQRYLWLDQSSGELRWSNQSITLSQFKRIALTHINKLFKIQQQEVSGFQLETHHHTIRFWSNTQEERDNWFIALNLALDKKENKPNRSFSTANSTPKNSDENKKNATPDKSNPSNSMHNLSYFVNKTNELSASKVSKSTIEYKNILVKLVNILNNASCESSSTQSSFEDLPQKLRLFLNQNLNSLASLNTKLQNPCLSPESSAFMQQVTALQDRVASLEAIKLEYDTQMHTLQGLSKSYQNEKQLTEDIAQILERLHLEKNKASRDCRLFKTELDFVTERNTQLEKKLQDLGVCEFANKYVEVMKGFSGMMSKRGKDTLERLISVSSEKDRLVFRPVDKFDTEREELMFSEITSISSAKKIESQVQITIHNLNVPIILNVAQEKAAFFTDITELFDEYKELQIEPIENLIAKQFKGNCNILESQLRFEEKRMKLYKSAVINSIFDVKNSMSASQSMFEAEISILRETLTKNQLGPVSENCMQYINKDRREILERISQLNSLVASCNRETEIHSANVCEVML